MRAILIFIIFALTLDSLGQLGVQFPGSSAVWKETYWWQPSPFFYNGIGETYLEGDTVINDTIYKKIYNLRRDVFCSNVIISDSEYNGGLREDTITKKVFYRPPSEYYGEKLLYDYNLQVGDTLPMEMLWNMFNYGIYVKSIDTITTNEGIERLIWYLDFEHPFVGWPQIIEGIGCTSGLLGGIEPYWEGWNELLCFSVGNDEVWRSIRNTCYVITDSCAPVGQTENKYEIITVYPNPFTTSTTFKYSLQHPSSVLITIFNHLGEQVAEIIQEQSSGKQQVVWNAKGQPSGVYYYRFQAGEQFASGKMIISK